MYIHTYIYIYVYTYTYIYIYIYRLELKLIRKEKDDIDERNFKAFEALMNSGKEIKRLRELEVYMYIYINMFV
jgi:hypothetical protein